jgi:acyl phosphate:glycerol-3-phosphate acyltransferase
MSVGGGAWFVPSGPEWIAPATAYLVGSVPFGLVLVRMFKGVDLRSIGSGNIGTTNAIRAGGKPLGYTVFALDFLKGFAPVFWLAPVLALGRERQVSLMVIAGALAVLGHCFSIYLKFEGGKGVATGYGALVALDPRVALAGGLVWVVALFALRYSGLASLLMGITFPIAALAFGRELGHPLVGGSILLALLIVVRHRSNIRRMLAGTEPKIGQKKGVGA